MAEFNPATDAALRGAFNQLGVRLAPDAKTSEMVDQLEQYQMTCSVDNGMLAISQHGAVVSTGTALRAFVGKFPQHFILPGGEVRSRDQLAPQGTPEGNKQRAELIAKVGYDGFRKIISNETLRPGVVANREMSRADWKNLTIAEKVAAVSADPGIVGHIMSKRST